MTYEDRKRLVRVAKRCFICSRPRKRSSSSWFCESCRRRRNTATEKRRRRLARAGRCRNCGKPRGESRNRSYCNICYTQVLEQCRLRLTGCSPAEYKKLFARQRGRCAICREKDNKRALCADHSHRTGVIRGLLCSACNCGIGYMRDSPILLRRAAKYLGITLPRS